MIELYDGIKGSHILMNVPIMSIKDPHSEKMSLFLYLALPPRSQQKLL